MTREHRISPFLSEKDLASRWNNPEVLLQYEQERYPFQRALGKIAAGVFHDYVPTDSIVFEVGAGQGLLKDLVPDAYHKRYITSDYNVRNLQAGQERRTLLGVGASANGLPFPDNSVNTLVDMDAYDTLGDLDEAIHEAKRVLTPDGTFIHFQVNTPSDDIVWYDYPDAIFFPTRHEMKFRPDMVGISREELERSLDLFDNPYRGFLEGFLKDPRGQYMEVLRSPHRPVISDHINNILDIIPADKIDVPNKHEYLKTKLTDTATQLGLQVVEAGYRGASITGPRNESQEGQPANQFNFLNGVFYKDLNLIHHKTGPTDVIERANMLVVVARK